MKTITSTRNGTRLTIDEPLIDVLILDRYEKVSLTISFRRLRKLTIRAANLLIISPVAFESLTNIQQLSLELPQLVALPANLFRKAIDLDELRLLLDSVHWIEVDTFRTNYNLRKLFIQSLAFNYRTELFENLFSLDELVLLNVRRIPISIYEPEKFYGSLRFLRTLRLQTLNTSQFTKLANLTRLNLTRSKLTDVNCLESFRNLVYLNVGNSFSDFTRLRSLNLPKLKTLILFRNYLRAKKLEFLQNLRNLRFLDMRECELSDLSTVHFGTYCPRLTNVSLRGNLLVEKKLNLNLFTNSFGVRQLDLSHNYLVSVRATGIFNSLINLTVLRLNNNQLSYLPMNCFKNLYNLQFLDLSCNYLTIFKVTWFDEKTTASDPSKVYGLRTLDLNFNLLRRVHGDDLRPFPYLRHLNLSRNSIDRLFANNFRFVPHLKKLNLTFNRLTCLRQEHFFGLDNIEFLFLYANALELVANDTFSHLDYLKYLTLTLAGNSNLNVNSLIFKNEKESVPSVLD